jgi:hypothetical protein
MASGAPDPRGRRHIDRPTWLAYLAGYLDGEGCFTLWHERTPVISVSNTFPYVLQALLGEFGGRINRKVTTHRDRTAWEWRVCGDRAIDAAEIVRPYLIEKRSQADLIIQVRTWPPGSQQRRNIVDRLRKLKKTDYGKEAV